MAHLGSYKKRKTDRDVYGIKAKEHIDVLEQTKREAAKGKGSKSFGLPAQNTMGYQKGKNGMKVRKYQEGAEVMAAEDETAPPYETRPAARRPVRPVPATITLSSEILPEVAEWTKGETYEVGLTIRQTSEPGERVTFEILSASTETPEEEETPAEEEVTAGELPEEETETETETEEEEEYPE